MNKLMAAAGDEALSVAIRAPTSEVGQWWLSFAWGKSFFIGVNYDIFFSLELTHSYPNPKYKNNYLINLIILRL